MSDEETMLPPNDVPALCLPEDDAGIASALALMVELDGEPRHARQVCFNSMLIFDCARGVHNFGDAERRLLIAGALVHDVGHSVDVARHHKHARDIVMARGLDGFSRDDIAIIACLARYHRKGHPAPGHKVYNSLSSRGQQVTTALAALLRIADGLDRSHFASTLGIRLEFKARVYRFCVRQRTPNPTDIWGAMRKRRLFEEVFATPVEIVPE